ncbi:uncharacterized protein LOC134814681 [Bolinopsis microptera]|uniref:uncharacterized protein LOC134814681 n=1 Tax=Bolinopsis microptera TaxID=2820187 RepID=UPI00307A7D21
MEYLQQMNYLHYKEEDLDWMRLSARWRSLDQDTLKLQTTKNYTMCDLFPISAQDDTTHSDSDSSLGSSIIVLPCFTPDGQLTDEVSLNPGSDSELRSSSPGSSVVVVEESDSEVRVRTLSSPGSSVVVVGESCDESVGEVETKVKEETKGVLCGPEYEGLFTNGTNLCDSEDEGLYTAATELWLSSTDQCPIKRRRVHSEPSPTLLTAGLTHSALFDQLSDLVGVQQTSNWGSVSPSVPTLSGPSWGSEQGSVSGAPPPSTASDDVTNQGDVTSPPRTTYTDEVLNGVFQGILENINAYHEEYEILAVAIRRLVEDNENIRGKVYLLEWECDNLRQEALSNRILIINVPTKLSPGKLRELVIRVAHRVGVFLESEDIRDVFYLFRRPSRTSPVIVIFMEHALGARRQILARKNRLQSLPMRTLEGFGRYSNTICVDEQLIGRRNELKQAARRVVKQGRLLDTWVLNGNVYVRDNQRRKHLLESQKALETVLSVD